MKKGEGVVVGIVTRNRVGVLPKALDSVAAQLPPVNRLVVVNDASNDSTPELAMRHSQIEWHHWPLARGLIAARNMMMETAPEEYFVSLDDDAWFMTGDEIAIALRHLRENQEIAAVAFDILSPDRPNRVARTRPVQTSMFIGCGHVLRLAAARAVGFYIPPPGLYGGEEKDLCLRLLDAGYRIDLLPGVHVWHDKTTVFRDIPAQHRSGVCNDLTMTLRRTPAALLAIALPVKIVRHFRFSLKNGLTIPFFRGLGLFLRSIHGLLKSRRAVKSSTLKQFLNLTRQHSPASSNG